MMFVLRPPFLCEGHYDIVGNDVIHIHCSALLYSTLL